MNRLLIPSGRFSDDAEDAAARRRREIREKLLKGEEIKVNQDGTVDDKSKDSNQPTITVPPGKLASLFWYERDRELFEQEKQAMNRQFPHFKLEKFSDGRLSWIGLVKTDLIKGGKWHLQVIYDNSHPHNSTYGGSIKVYSIEPDLKKISDEVGAVPHLLRDSHDHLYICTSRPEDFQAAYNRSTSAASSIAWAVKWISAFELWMAGDLTTEEFSGHRI